MSKMLLVLLAQQTTAAADPLGPVISYVVSLGLSGVIIFLGMTGRIDLFPSASREREAELKALNLALVQALDKKGDDLESVVLALKANTEQFGRYHNELYEVRLALASLKKD